MHRIAARIALPLLLSAMAAAGLAPVAAGPAPEATIDRFHRALQDGDRAVALSLLSEDLVVYEMGAVESSRAAYADHHLAEDMLAASRARRRLLHRRTSGTGARRWVLSRYRLSFQGREWTSLETIVLRQFEDAWRIAHIHWSARR